MFAVESKYRNLSVYLFSALFILVNAAIVYYLGNIYFSLLSVIFLVAVIGLIAYDKLFFIIAFLTPLSLSLSYFFPDLPFDLSVFTEPLLAYLLLILTVKFVLYHKIDIAIVAHPVSVALLFNLLWMLIATSTSSIPVVSVKYFIARLWFVVPVFFFGVKLFKKYDNTKIFIWAYAITLFVVVIYTTLRLSHTSFFAKNAAHFAVKPFYKDHTAYGAITAFFSPVFWLLAFNKKYKPYARIIALIFAVSFTGALFLSYSRAAWLGFAVSLAVFVFVKLRIKFKYILAASVLIAAFAFAFWFQILDRLEKNRQDSSSNLSEQIMSMTNVSTDASNLERLNRWYCAIEMFKEKPITGWGPGTYQFQYAPFQLERMKTIISTDFGDVGNSHSEYLGPLAEQGVLGLVSVLWLFTSILVTGLKIYRKAKDDEVKILILGITMSFVTYFIHGLMNNFLDTDKLAVPFFGFAAILVAIDLYHRDRIIS